MTWMLTATGVAYELEHLQPGQISILDIAQHLAQKNRYSGACCRPYSVAEHSLFVAWILEHVCDVKDPNVIAAGLLHDAHEAYTGDVTSPVKRVLGDVWRSFERRHQLAVERNFKITVAALDPQIHWADMTALATERSQLLPAGGPEWPVESTHPALPESTWCFAELDDFTWLDWRTAFLDRHAELNYARAEWARDRDGEQAPPPFLRIVQ
jgi:hypothetical protein